MEKSYILEGITLNGYPLYVVGVFYADWEIDGCWVFDHTEVRCNGREVT